MMNEGLFIILSTIKDKKIIAGMKNSKLTIYNETINCSNLESGNWRKLMENSGESFVNITASGIVIDNIADKLLQKLALEKKSEEFELSFDSGNKLAGRFHVTNYSIINKIFDEISFVINLESSGVINFIESNNLNNSLQ